MGNKGWLAALGSCAMLLSLAACGGGGSDADTKGVAPVSQGSASPGGATTGSTTTGGTTTGGTTTGTTGNTPTGSTPAGCAPITGTADAWLPNRLSCFTAGQKVLTYTSAATGAGSDVAVILNEKIFDAGFYNVLPGDTARYYKYFACLKNVPDGVMGSSSTRLNIATDIAIAVRTDNGSAKGNQIGAITIGMAGGNQAGYVSQTCNGNQHPLIIDYPTGKVLSVNPQALSAIETYDH